MPANRVELVTDWTDQTITAHCRSQGWDPDQWEYAISVQVANGQQGPGNWVTIWTILLTLDSVLVGQPAFVYPARIMGARPTEQMISEGIGACMSAMWQARMAQLGVKPKAGSNGHKPLVLGRG